jgi:hypothetical protein
MFYRISVLLFAVVLLTVLSPMPSSAESDDKGASQCASSIKALTQGLELWSNSHNGKFPTKEEFASKAFAECLAKAGSGAAMKCPSSGKTYIYVPLSSQKSYMIKCPTPEKHGLAAFYYSRDKGLVKEEKGSAASKPSASGKDVAHNKKTAAQTPSPKPTQSPAAKPEQTQAVKPTQAPPVKPAKTQAQTSEEKPPVKPAAEAGEPEKNKEAAEPQIEEKGVSPCTSRMMALIQGVELWSNSHQGRYPTSEEFSSKAFKDCYRKSCKGDVEKEMKCPLSGKPYLFFPMQAQKSYVIKCPTPEAHGLGALYYSRDKGIVKVAARELPAKFGKVAVKPSVPAGKTQEKPGKPQKEPGKTDTLPSSFDGKEDVTKEDREQITALITELYNAYADRNLDKILEIQHAAIEASAVDYEKRKKGSADEVRDAFRDATKEIIEHKEYKLLPLNLSDITIARRGQFYKVTSVVPIIATDRLEVQEEGKYFFVRLRIGEMIFEKDSSTNWKIVNMYLY